MNWWKFIQITSALFIFTLIFCEFIIYYVVLLQCKWPDLLVENNTEAIRAMLLADTHLLGPFRGHWFDKLRREWQMHRSFQTAVTLFDPEVIFFLGDIFDEGHWVDRKGFTEYMNRFYKLFHTPETIKTIGIVGNHDVGFHYRLHPELLHRFNKNFNTTSVTLHTIRDVHFVTINSMAMEGDKCDFCTSALENLNDISNILNCAKDVSTCDQASSPKLVYSKPIVLQHFPTFRSSDKNCLERDTPEIEAYRPKWEVLSKDATDLIGKTLSPRLMFSGHSHHYCRLENRLKVEEYTISSFSWRNKNNPSFILALFTPESYAVSVCYMPEESTVQCIYCLIFLCFVLLATINLIYEKTKAVDKLSKIL